MYGTVKQFKDTLEEMKSVYNYDDDKTELTTTNVLNMRATDYLEIHTIDERTGITVILAKEVRGNDPTTRL